MLNLKLNIFIEDIENFHKNMISYRVKSIRNIIGGFMNQWNITRKNYRF